MSEEVVGEAAAAIVGAYFVMSDEESGPSRERLESLQDLVRQKIGVQGGDYAKALLQQVEEAPGDDEAQVALGAVIAQEAVNDPSFRAALDGTLRSALADPGVAQSIDRAVVGTAPGVISRLRRLENGG